MNDRSTLHPPLAWSADGFADMGVLGAGIDVPSGALTFPSAIVIGTAPPLLPPPPPTGAGAGTGGGFVFLAPTFGPTNLVHIQSDVVGSKFGAR